MKTILKISLLLLLVPALNNSFAQKAKAKPAKQKYGCSAELPHDGMYLGKPDIASSVTLDTTKGRGLADNYYLWKNGQTIYVKFLSGTPAQQEQMKRIIKEWEQYANVKFEFVTFGASNIRINLDNKGGHNSLIGIMANSVSQDEKTVNFDTTDFRTYSSMHRTVLHEMGHAIGFLHEHYSPKAGVKWNKEAVYAELKRTQGWDKETVDVNLFQQYNLTYTNGTAYDKKSIMHYPIFSRWTTDGYSVDWNDNLSTGDIEMAGLMYPKNTERTNEFPRFSITDFTTMVVNNNATKQGLSLFPSFNISTEGREARVYFTVFFYDEAGNPIMDNDDKYNISNVVATFKSFVVPAGKKMSANKLDPQDFELFIPYSEIPVTSGKVQAVFKVFLLDDKEFKFLYSSKPKMLSIIK